MNSTDGDPPAPFPPSVRTAELASAAKDLALFVDALHRHTLHGVACSPAISAKVLLDVEGGARGYLAECELIVGVETPSELVADEGPFQLVFSVDRLLLTERQSGSVDTSVYYRSATGAFVHLNLFTDYGERTKGRARGTLRWFPAEVHARQQLVAEHIEIIGRARELLELARRNADLNGLAQVAEAVDQSVRALNSALIKVNL